jgi:hypothetical protein
MHEKLGFIRAEKLDFSPQQALQVYAFRLTLQYPRLNPDRR